METDAGPDISDTAPIHHVDLGKGQKFAVPGALGHLKRLDLRNGFTLFQAELEIYHDCTLEFARAIEEPWIGGTLHVQGRSIIEMTNGQTFEVSPQTAAFSRFDSGGTKFHLTGGQVLRHVGVSTTASNLRYRLDGTLPDRLRPHLEPEDGVLWTDTFPIGNQLRSLATSLFSPQRRGPAHALHLESISALMFSKMVDAYCEDTTVPDDILEWEREAFLTVVNQIQSDIGTLPPVPLLAGQVNLTESRLNQLFRLNFETTCANFIRTERLTTAHHLLEKGGLSVKEVASAVGYSHVSNFSRAYRDRFGEPPARTLRRTTNGPDA
ncbi:AraC family transcriptional regulator [Sneathiella chinensis]|uniref:HTH araC/xylS-type domain-containing protein n=1 Tax=Sneathiella chinensis TaxID=349750 RepID=A0ABQ5TYM1_9PROT|nr:helix-turn-helix domain-containing protein [Sneathiella chinensis]GLQ05072.1 hypothetical protein GCM10007924_02930 [Sneathiella chinensis]